MIFCLELLLLFIFNHKIPQEIHLNFIYEIYCFISCDYDIVFSCLFGIIRLDEVLKNIKYHVKVLNGSVDLVSSDLLLIFEFIFVFYCYIYCVFMIEKK